MLEEKIQQLIENNEISESKKWKTYMYNGTPVPRVSEILKSMLHDEYLLGWANSLGFKRQSYTKVRDLSAMKGTLSHNMIEEFLTTNSEIKDFSHIEDQYRFAVYNCYNGFMEWYRMMEQNTDSFHILEIEKTLSCPYFGGTLDILAEINGKIYIIDLKTSNHMSYKYYIQLGAYTYMLQNYYNIKIDGGVFILWLDKNQIRYKDYVLSADNPEHITMMNQSIDTFLSLLYGYYNKCILVDQYNNIFKGELV